MTVASAPAIPDILEEHLDEAAFLWGQWERALASPRYTIAEVAAGPEERLQAHLAGLLAGGEEALAGLLLPALGEEDEGLVAAAGAALAGAGLLESLRAAAPKASDPGRAVSRALALSLPAGAEQVLLLWLGGGGPAEAIAAEVLALRGGLSLALATPYLRSKDPRLVEAGLIAAGAAGEMGRAAVEAALPAKDPAIRDAAIQAGLRIGLRAALLRCRLAADAAEPGAALPLEVLALSGEREDLDRIRAALASPDRCPQALWAAGLSGWAAAGDLCLPHLGDPRLGRLAFEALVAIGGAPIAEVPPPPAELVAEQADEAPAELPSAEADLPLRDADLVESAWQRLRPSLPDGKRLLVGHALSAEVAWSAFAEGPTRRRHPLALELLVRSRGEVRLDTRAWARDQLATQATVGGAPRADFAQPFSRFLKG